MHTILKINFYKFSLLVFAFLFFHIGIKAQSFKEKDSLQKLCLEIWNQETDSAKVEVSNRFSSYFYSFLSDKNLPANALDSIKGIVHVKSSDEQLQIFTWNLPLHDGSFLYKGFIRANGNIFAMDSKESSNRNIAENIIDISKWYGALYYKLIESELRGKKIYTLLGWDGYNARQDRKIIDIINIHDKKITFGAPLFKTKEGLKNRVVIDYADRGNMVMRYDRQFLKVEKGKNISKEKRNFIVMDRLHPIIPEYENNRSFYVPSGDFYDAFMMLDGYWVFVEDIEVANPR